MVLRSSGRHTHVDDRAFQEHGRVCTIRLDKLAAKAECG